jgi:hypothetical protein
MPSRPQRAAWYVVGLFTVAYVFSFVDRQIVSLLIDPIQADLRISDTQFGLLVGLAFSIFYATRRTICFAATTVIAGAGSFGCFTLVSGMVPFRQMLAGSEHTDATPRFATAQ